MPGPIVACYAVFGRCLWETFSFLRGGRGRWIWERGEVGGGTRGRGRKGKCGQDVKYVRRIFF